MKKPKTFIAIYVENLRTDVKKIAKERKTNVSAVLERNKINTAIFAQAIHRETYYNGEDAREGVGQLDTDVFLRICELFGVDYEEYMVDKPQKEDVTCNHEDVTAKVSDLTAGELHTLIYDAVYTAVKKAWEND